MTLCTFACLSFHKRVHTARISEENLRVQQLLVYGNESRIALCGCMITVPGFDQEGSLVAIGARIMA